MMLFAGCKKSIEISDTVITTFAAIGVSGYADVNGVYAKFHGTEGIDKLTAD